MSFSEDNVSEDDPDQTAPKEQSDQGLHYLLFCSQDFDTLLNKKWCLDTVQILCIGTDRSQQTVQTKIRLLLKKQSDQALRCLLFHQHLLNA